MSPKAAEMARGDLRERMSWEQEKLLMLSGLTADENTTGVASFREALAELDAELREGRAELPGTPAARDGAGGRPGRRRQRGGAARAASPRH